LMEMMQTKYNTDPLGNAFILGTDAKKAVTQIDIYSGPELFFTLVNSDRQNFALRRYKFLCHIHGGHPE